MHTKARPFRDTVWGYYLQHKRYFPWRETTDPYAILVSEFMLQQTQTDRVVPKYETFLSVFPTIETLSQASFPKVFTYWQGLGYNRRAKYLLQTAKNIQENFKGLVPSQIATLETLPGIGPYTARAILTFAYNQPHLFLETNIRSAIIYYFLRNKTTIHDRELIPLLEDTLDKSNPREWYYALMDYGSMIKKKYGNPNKKSAHYTKQSSFIGSNRQVRGQILKLLSTHPSLSLTELESRLFFDSEKLSMNLTKLEQEGFICRDQNDRYKLS